MVHGRRIVACEVRCGGRGFAASRDGRIAVGGKLFTAVAERSQRAGVAAYGSRRAVGDGQGSQRDRAGLFGGGSLHYHLN